MRVLAGDIGGTNARLAIVEVGDGEARILREQCYRSREFSSLAAIVERFREAGERVERAACGVAGRVLGGLARPPNLPWIVAERELSTAAGTAKVSLVNDFEAVGRGLSLLGPRDLEPLQRGEPVPHGAIALIGAGTGLGEAFMLWDGGHYRVYPSEGGHANFAPRDDLEWGLATSLMAEFGHVSYERVASGPGLASVYRYLATARFAPERAAVREDIGRDDPAAVIVRHALAAGDALCGKALDIFISAFGSAAGNLALTVFATGGVYVAGGIAPRIVAKLRGGAFLAAFRCKGRLAEFLTRVPVHVILNPKVGLLGAAAVAAALP